MIKHPIPPVFDEGCRVLILGSFPSVRSRADGFYYGHPKNRFWRVLSLILGYNTPETVAEKKLMLLSNHIALWDVIASCEIEGSSDASIRGVTANNIGVVTSQCDIAEIFVNGGTASKLYDRYILPSNKTAAVRLPSTSPANASWNLERLTEAWKVILIKQSI